MNKQSMLFPLALVALLCGLVFSSCKEAQKQTPADVHHLSGTEWADSTGTFTLHFNSPEEVQLRLNYAGPPMGEMKYNIACHLSGDTVYIEDYKKTTPFARITILKGFKGVVAGTSLVASFVTSDAKVEAGATFPTFTEVPLEEVVFSKK